MGIAKPETVYIVRQTIEVYNWEEYQEAIGKKEKVNKAKIPSFLEKTDKEAFSKKLALTLSEAETTDYRNEKLE